MDVLIDVISAVLLGRPHRLEAEAPSRDVGWRISDSEALVLYHPRPGELWVREGTEAQTSAHRIPAGATGWVRGPHRVTDRPDESPRVFVDPFREVEHLTDGDCGVSAVRTDLDPACPHPLMAELPVFEVAAESASFSNDIEVAISRALVPRDGRSGFLAALGDPMLAAALTCIHQAPAEAWTLAELAKEAGTSRSVFAARFKEVLGTSPMQYVTQWRMQQARALLVRERPSLADVAERVGYQSEFAFAKAFKRVFGVGPGRVRRMDWAQWPSARTATSS